MAAAACDLRYLNVSQEMNLLREAASSSPTVVCGGGGGRVAEIAPHLPLVDFQTVQNLLHLRILRVAPRPRSASPCVVLLRLSQQGQGWHAREELIHIRPLPPRCLSPHHHPLVPQLAVPSVAPRQHPVLAGDGGGEVISAPDPSHLQVLLPRALRVQHLARQPAVLPGPVPQLPVPPVPPRPQHAVVRQRQRVVRPARDLDAPPLVQRLYLSRLCNIPQPAMPELPVVPAAPRVDMALAGEGGAVGDPDGDIEDEDALHALEHEGPALHHADVLSLVLQVHLPVVIPLLYASSLLVGVGVLLLLLREVLVDHALDHLVVVLLEHQVHRALHLRVPPAVDVAGLVKSETKAGGYRELHELSHSVILVVCVQVREKLERGQVPQLVLHGLETLLPSLRAPGVELKLPREVRPKLCGHLIGLRVDRHDSAAQGSQALSRREEDVARGLMCLSFLLQDDLVSLLPRDESP
mmetsp:Transcript_937/g.2964  ORF Transcript_937/g.2964 Transcript_937/m.2964 type:complete len:467 (+) Transcript_937:704-2104(+)